MKRIFRAATLVAVAAVGATPALSADLTFRYRPDNAAALRDYDNQPYWRLLSECGGVYGSLSNRYTAAGDAAAAQTAKDQGVRYAQAAMRQLSTDRGVTSSQALDMLTADIGAGRSSGDRLLSRSTGFRGGHEQLADLFCGQVEQGHRSALMASNTAVDTSLAAGGSTSALVKPEDKIVCKSVRYTGSMMPERVCETKAQSDRRREALRDRQAKGVSKSVQGRRSFRGF